MEKFRSHWTDYNNIIYMGIFRKFVEEIQVSLKYGKNNGEFYMDTSVHSW